MKTLFSKILIYETYFRINVFSFCSHLNVRQKKMNCEFIHPFLFVIQCTTNMNNMHKHHAHMTMYSHECAL